MSAHGQSSLLQGVYLVFYGFMFASFMFFTCLLCLLLVHLLLLLYFCVSALAIGSRCVFCAFF